VTLGFKQFSNLRAVYERPNSGFLDIPLRYTGMDSSKRLATMKKLEFSTTLTLEEVICYASWVLIPAFIYLVLWLGVKYNLVAFPAFGIGAKK
jgi:hypothetical protein